jgi:wyosine [tRNA(Phe)-imidazoG37] synthetase (radical SAM superfamily)
MISFGPIPSRRLGRSLGINNIPPKTCPYACVYCQVGRTNRMQVERETFYEPEKILQDVESKIRKARQAGEPIDYLTFVPDGEPSLDANLGREIELLRPLGIRTAVITNCSLIWRADVREALTHIDWVSLKVDAVREQTWRQVNRPHGRLQSVLIQDGALKFARTYGGKLVTETMLVADVNDGEADIRAVADFLGQLEPTTAYLSIPTRPPAEKWVRAPGEAAINRAYQILSQAVDHVEYLIGYEGNAFAFTGNVEEDLLSITAVHPMREEAVDAFLKRAGATWSVVHQLIAQDQLVQTAFEGRRFYVRKLH